MKRVLFNIAAGISLVLAIGVGGFWVHSHFASDDLGLRHFSYWSPTVTERDCDLSSVDGELWLIIEGYWIYPATKEEAAAERREWDSMGPTVSWGSDPEKGRTFNYPRRSDNFLIKWGFRYEPDAGSPQNWGNGQMLRQDFRQFGVPHWAVMVVLLVLPVVWVRRRVREHRYVANNLCRKCGYDLRATPDRCPECGTSVGNAE